MSRDLQQLTEDVRALQLQVRSLEKELRRRDTSPPSRTTPNTNNTDRQRRAVSPHSFPAKKTISGGTSTSQRISGGLISDGLISTSPVLTSRVLTSQTNPGDPELTSSLPGYPVTSHPGYPLTSHQGVAYRVGDSVVIQNQVPLPPTEIDNYQFTLARQAIITKVTKHRVYLLTHYGINTWRSRKNIKPLQP